MLAVYCASFSASDPLSGLVVGDRPEPEARPGFTRVAIKATSINHHDLWSLKGIGLKSEHLPMILGCDGAGIDEDGNEVIIHPVMASPGWTGDETLDPKRSIFSELEQGLMSEVVVVPTASLLPKPAGMSWETAAVLPTAWLTAYRMVFERADVSPGQLILVQGVGGGVNSAAIQLASAAGIRVWATSRDQDRRDLAITLGAEQAFEPGARLPEKVDAVIENVGAATWSHSINVLRPGGTLVTCGATSGDAPVKAELTKIFFRQLRVLGSTTGTKQQHVELSRFVQSRGIEPAIDRVLPLSQAREGFAAMADGTLRGKVVLTVD